MKSVKIILITRKATTRSFHLQQHRNSLLSVITKNSLMYHHHYHHPPLQGMRLHNRKAFGRFIITNHHQLHHHLLQFLKLSRSSNQNYSNIVKTLIPKIPDLFSRWRLTTKKIPFLHRWLICCSIIITSRLLLPHLPLRQNNNNNLTALNPSG